MDITPQQMMQNTLVQLTEQFSNLAPLNIDLTRGKPCAEQLALSDSMAQLIAGDYLSKDGIDTRNYGGLDGLDEAKKLGSWLLDTPPEQVLVGGNSSLTLMSQAMLVACQFGLNGKPWKAAKFICPAPGYDRHFALCELFGIEMIPVAMTDAGPDMDAVEAIVANDPQVMGMWCVPKYSNPTGATYSSDTVERLAKLPLAAAEGFKIFWDNAYSVHDLSKPVALTSLWLEAEQANTLDSMLMFASTSKITHAGSGLAFMASSDKNLADIKRYLGFITIGPDKVNQIRHSRFFATEQALQAHMAKHADILQPKFTKTIEVLEKKLAGKGVATWSTALGGYFISVDTAPGLASRTVELAGLAGVKFTPAGATFPYGKDPLDRNIRIAPSMADIEEVEQAMDVFCLCLKIAALEQGLAKFK